MSNACSTDTRSILRLRVRTGGEAWQKTRKIVRDAGTGRIVPTGDAKKRPKETVTETVPTKRKSSRKKR